jgi:chromosome segregation ATPase
MNKLGGLLGLKANGESRAQPGDNVIGVDEELFSPAGQMGEENEAVRNLLLDAEFRIGELDAIKTTFGKLVDPINKALRQVEIEKAEKLSLQTILNNTRAAHSKIRTEFAQAEKKIAAFETETTRLKEDLSAAQQILRATESVKAEQSVEIAAQRTKLLDLERRLQQEVLQKDAMRDEARRFAERVASADKRIVQLESETEAARQKVVLSDRERNSLQSSLDLSHEEVARVSRRLVEAEKAFASTHARLLQTEAGLAEANGERARFAAALDDATERHRAELTSHHARHETLKTRATATEKLLEEARRSMTDRADELRTFDRRLVEASLIRNTLEGKLGDIERAHAEREAQLQELEQIRNALIERNVALTKQVVAREAELNRTEEKALALNDQIGLLEHQLQSTQMSAEQQIESLTAELQREKLERSMAEGALETGRKDFARLLREISTLQARREASGEAPLPLPKYVNAA